MNLERCSVRHIRYGVGTVLRHENAMITVEFPDVGEKQFLFPGAFERFLKAEDPECAAAIAELIILKKAEEDAVRREREALKQAMAEAQAAARAAKPRRSPRRHT